jgi:hypothetical protein
MPGDDDPLEPDGSRATWTRTELLKARGYPDDIVNGHATPESVTTVTEPPSALAEGEAVPSTCRQCGTELTGPPSRVWCSDRCRRRYRTEHETPRQRPALTAPTNEDTDPCLHTGEPARPDLAALLCAVLDQPWQEISILLEGVSVTVARRS